VLVFRLVGVVQELSVVGRGLVRPLLGFLPVLRFTWWRRVGVGAYPWPVLLVLQLVCYVITAIRFRPGVELVWFGFRQEDCGCFLVDC